MHLEEPRLTPARPRNSSDLTHSSPRALVTAPPRRPCTHVVLDLEGILLSLAVGECVVGGPHRISGAAAALWWYPVVGSFLGRLWAKAAEVGLGIRSPDNALP